MIDKINILNKVGMLSIEDKGMIVAGCQIHYAVKSNKPPNMDKIKDFNYGDGKFSEFERPYEIYKAE